MPHDGEKVQIGIRLPVKVVTEIDARRLNTTRAEYCRNLIERALAPSRGSAMNDAACITESLEAALEPLRAQLLEITQAGILVQRDTGTVVKQVWQLRRDLATAVVGILTLIGQAVRQEDKRPFARKEAEAFARRVLLAEGTDVTEGDS